MVTTMKNDTISRQAALDIYDDYNVAVENGELEAYRKHRERLLKLPPAHPDFGAYCDRVYQIALERGHREVIDFVGAMNMCDEVNDEAYKKLVTHFENIPLEG